MSPTHRSGSGCPASILRPRQHRAFSLAPAPRPMGCGRSGSKIAMATASLGFPLRWPERQLASLVSSPPPPFSHRFSFSRVFFKALFSRIPCLTPMGLGEESADFDTKLSSLLEREWSRMLCAFWDVFFHPSFPLPSLSFLPFLSPRFLHLFIYVCCVPGTTPLNG